MTIYSYKYKINQKKDVLLNIEQKRRCKFFVNYVDAIFSRADIRQIRSFLLEGVSGKPDPRSYKERIRDADNRMDKELSRWYPDMSDREKVAEFIYNYVDVMTDVYMEIGLQVGALLVGQVWHNLSASREKACDES